MPFYYSIEPTEEGRRTARRLMQLQDALRDGAGDPSERNFLAPVPRRTQSETLLLATWNIREFDSTKYGRRRAESLAYIAELISHFDLVAVQEVHEDISALKNVRRLLGRHWKFLVTDVTAGRGGNSERMAYLYDVRTVRPTGLVGEVVLPPTKSGPARQLARTPFLVGFQAGWFKFSLCSVHIYYGGDEADQPQRVAEIDALAKFLSKRVKAYRKKYREQGGSHSEYENIALLGDFNIFSTEDATFKALTKHGFRVPAGLLGKATNVGKKARAFDQLAFLEDEKNIEATGHAGVIDFFRVVYTDDDRDVYADVMAETIDTSNANRSPSQRSTPYSERSAGKQNTYYRAWRTFQMSDHLPLWVELRIDFSREYLQRKSVPAEES